MRSCRPATSMRSLPKFSCPLVLQIGAPDERAAAGGELGLLKRFHQKIVRAQIKRFDPQRNRLARGQDEDGQRCDLDLSGGVQKSGRLLREVRYRPPQDQSARRQAPWRQAPRSARDLPQSLQGQARAAIASATRSLSSTTKIRIAHLAERAKRRILLFAGAACRQPVPIPPTRAESPAARAGACVASSAARAHAERAEAAPARTASSASASRLPAGGERRSAVPPP